MDDEHAKIAADLGMHAGTEAMKALMRVVLTAPKGCEMAVTACACAFLQNKLDGMFKLGTPEENERFKTTFEGIRATLSRASETVLNDIRDGKIRVTRADLEGRL